jgi:hypothetical protein
MTEIAEWHFRAIDGGAIDFVLIFAQRIRKSSRCFVQFKAQ